MWGEVYEPLVDDQWPHNPHFAENRQRRPQQKRVRSSPPFRDVDRVPERRGPATQHLGAEPVAAGFPNHQASVFPPLKSV